jgi:hypothetical protein
MRVTGAQALAFRVARHHLHERTATAQEAAVAGLQDTPPHAARIALAARVADASPETLDELVIVPSVRGAPLAVAPADLAIFTTGLAPPDEAAARALLQTAVKELDGISALEALDRVSAAVADALAGGPLERDDFHQALRERLPPQLLRWCEGCQSHHVHPSLWRATGVRGVLAIAGRDARGGAIMAAPPEAPSVADPGAELARRFLAAYGPATPRLFAQWSGLAPEHARALWDRAGALEPAEVDGRAGFVAAGDAAALADPPPARGVRLLAGLDPLLAGRDRELLVPDAASRKRVWRALSNPGVVLADGEITGLWRAARKGKRLVVTVEPLGDGPSAPAGALAEEAARLAPMRGAERAEVSVVA